jgi:competence protein ComEC
VTRWTRIAAQALAFMCAFTAFGACAAQVRAWSVAQPAFSGGGEPIVVEGWVVSDDSNESGPRLRLLVSSMEGVEAPPRYVRLAVREAGVLTPGRGARCRGSLSLPSGPLAPGGYDFARRAYFERLGASGFALGRCHPVDLAAPPHWLDRARLRLASVRSDLTLAIEEAAPGRGGAIAAALVTGDQGAVDQETMVALRDSGLGHLLSVSGVHMGVVGGLTFAALLALFSLIEPIALRWPVKKIAAVGALIVLAVYLVISGSSVPALRSFVMACVAFGAILLDRPAVSMRGLALAALIVIAFFPESVLEPGFQMSFAATMALVALFEAHKGGVDPLPTPGPIVGALQASVRGIGGVLLISLVAGLATDPFAIYHFQRFSIYALPANLIVAPIMSFLVAPAAGVAAVLAPFGWAEAPLQLMAGALDLVAAVGATFGDRPEAVRAMPRPPDLAFLLCVGALLWACLWRGALRWGGLALLAACVAVYATAPAPVVAFDRDLRAVFMRDDSGAWTLLSDQRRSAYARERLGAMLGLAPAAVARLAAPEGCEAGHMCQWRSHGLAFATVAVADSTPGPLCAERLIVFARADSGAGACARWSVIDPTDRAARGGGFIYAVDGGVRIVRAQQPNLAPRPWRRSTLASQE